MVQVRAVLDSRRKNRSVETHWPYWYLVGANHKTGTGLLRSLVGTSVPCARGHLLLPSFAPSRSLGSTHHRRNPQLQRFPGCAHPLRQGHRAQRPHDGPAPRSVCWWGNACRDDDRDPAAMLDLHTAITTVAWSTACSLLPIGNLGHGLVSCRWVC